MKIRKISTYRGPTDDDGLVRVYDITVSDTHLYVVAGIVVSNSKRISLLDVNALLAHGATETLKDAGSVRGQKNENYWLQFMSGNNPTAVKVPLVYEKFVNQLKAAGINVVRKGARTNVMALTNADVDQLAGDRVIRSADTVNFDKDLKPVPGGLFDPQLTGGHGGKNWSKIQLHEKMPNPVMEEPIRHMLNLTKDQFEKVISGEHELPKYGTGPQAISKALSNIDVKKELAYSRAQLHSATGNKLDDAVRKLGYLKSAEKLSLHPSEWVLGNVPVLPPAFRPVSVMGGSGLPMVNDANYLYKELFDTNKNLAEMTRHVGDEGVGPERLALYHSFKAVAGLGGPVHPKLQDKGVKGILATIFGSAPKFGTMQRKLLSSTVDNVGRAVISPNPDYDMDTVGIPEGKAFDVYGKFIVRRLVRKGMKVTQALDEIKNKTDAARDMLQQEMADRPVIINRAPVLHKFGIMAFRPQLIKGDVMQVSPLIVKGFNADFDGDAMQFHVPTTDEAKKEALERLLPSRNLLSPADFKSPVHIPGQEYLGGLNAATSAGTSKRPVRVFRNKRDVIAAHQRGEIGVKDQIHILEP